ncbi:MAG: holo-ACP synthase [Elusimicrobiota bacterium]
MKIIGTGIDIIEVERIKRIVRSNKRFVAKVFSREEVVYCNQCGKSKWQHYAVRFAAKEAVWKSLSDTSLPLKRISVKNTPQGKPEVYIRGKRVKNIYLSLSHTEHYAVAQAVAVKL